jgi:hypothetical protein
MKSPLIAGALLLGVIALAVPACSDGNPPVASGSQKTSETRPSGSSSKGNGSNGGGTNDGGSTATTLPDLGSVAGEMGECVQVVTTYTSLALGVIDGPDGAKKAQQEAEALKPKLPPELADDIDVVSATFAKIADEGVLDGLGGLNDPAFTEANQNITDYLQKNCVGS